MTVFVDNEVIFTDQIMRNAKAFNQRTGQFLFNHLPEGARNAIVGTKLDTFHEQLSTDEIFLWLDNHLIFDGGRIIAVFDGNDILWEES